MGNYGTYLASYMSVIFRYLMKAIFQNLKRVRTKAKEDPGQRRF